MTIKEFLVAFEVPVFVRRLIMTTVLAKYPEVLESNLKLKFDKINETVSLIADEKVIYTATFADLENFNINGPEKGHTPDSVQISDNDLCGAPGLPGKTDS